MLAFNSEIRLPPECWGIKGTYHHHLAMHNILKIIFIFDHTLSLPLIPCWTSPLIQLCVFFSLKKKSPNERKGHTGTKIEPYLCWPSTLEHASFLGVVAVPSVTPVKKTDFPFLIGTNWNSSLAMGGTRCPSPLLLGLVAVNVDYHLDWLTTHLGVQWSICLFVSRGLSQRRLSEWVKAYQAYCIGWGFI